MQQINKSCHLILKNLFFYDFKSAAPRILSQLGWNFENVNLENKDERSISIGMQQRDNENLSSFLNSAMQNLIEYYIKTNNLNDIEDVIIRQKDGFITTKILYDTSSLMTLDYRGEVDLLIITPDRRKFLYFQDDNVSVKGVSKKYPALNLVYQKFYYLNYYDKKVLFRQLQEIKDSICKSDDKLLFMIPLDDNQFGIRCKDKDRIISGVKSFSIDDIDRDSYFDHYVKEFCQSVFLEFY